MATLEKTILNLLDKMNATLLESSMLDIISKFMYTNVYRRFGYDLKHCFFDADISVHLNFFKHAYPGYDWIYKYTRGIDAYFVAIGNSCESDENIVVCYPIGTCDFCDMFEILERRIQNQQEDLLIESIDKILNCVSVTKDPKEFILGYTEYSEDEFEEFFKEFDSLNK
jgi:hypothetical protein